MIIDKIFVRLEVIFWPLTIVQLGYQLALENATFTHPEVPTWSH